MAFLEDIKACAFKTPYMHRILFWHTFRTALEANAFWVPRQTILKQCQFTWYFACVFQKYTPSFARFRRKAYETAKRNRSKVAKDWFFYWKLLVAPNSPFFVKRTWSGLGVFARNNISSLEASSLLIGFVVPASPSIIRFLRSRGYPSLYRNGILIGPLALVNHQCNVPQTFTPNIVNRIPLFKLFTLVRITGKNGIWKQDEEITLRYGFSFNPCLCDSCAEFNSETSEEEDEL